MKKLFDLVRKFRYRSSCHVRVLIRFPKDPDLVLLVRNQKRDGFWHLPGGRSRMHKKHTPVRSAVSMVKDVLNADLLRPIELTRYKKKRFDLSEITVVVGEAEVDLLQVFSECDYRWYPATALLANPKVDELTKYAVNRLPIRRTDSRTHQDQVA